MKISTIIVVIFLMLVSLLPKMDLEQLSKISYLVEHFSEHSEKDGISFLDFLVLHYGENSHSNHHSQKEFPCQDVNANTIFVFVLVHQKSINFNTITSATKTQFIYLESALLQFSSKIFQPPKIA